MLLPRCSLLRPVLRWQVLLPGQWLLPFAAAFVQGRRFDDKTSFWSGKMGAKERTRYVKFFFLRLGSALKAFDLPYKFLDGVLES